MAKKLSPAQAKALDRLEARKALLEHKIMLRKAALAQTDRQEKRPNADKKDWQRKRTDLQGALATFGDELAIVDAGIAHLTG